MKKRIQHALNYLNHLIVDEGREYPDALDYVSLTYNLSDSEYAELALEYDNQGIRHV